MTDATDVPVSIRPLAPMAGEGVDAASAVRHVPPPSWMGRPISKLIEREPRLVPALAYLPAAVAGLAFLWFCTMIGAVARGDVLVWRRPWIEEIGVETSFLVDGLGLMFALLVTGIGALIFTYAAGYFDGDPRRARILTLLSLFAIAMLGLVLADDVVTLFLFWEGTTITSFLLVGFDYQKAYARRAALQALLVTGLGGLALLGGLVILGEAMGSYRLSEWNAAGQAVKESGVYGWVLALVLLGAFTKSAQFPFHFWLPGAMAAPTPVSAYLHSATMVKAGVYLLMRLMPSLGGTEAWFWILTAVGAVTMLIGSIWALRQSDLKQMLAHTTVMGLGTLVMFLGGGTEKAVLGASLFLLVHALYKASLFLMVGCLDKKAGTREVDQLAGLGRAMPITAAAAALAALSMAGAPPFVGFLGKEVMYEGAFAVVTEPALVTAAAYVANAMMVAVALIVAVGPFHFRAQASPKATPVDPPWTLLAGPVALAGLGLLLGLFAPLTGELFTVPVAAAILGRPVDYHLYLWHGINPAFVLSLATFALGYLFWRGATAFRNGLSRAEERGLGSADLGYDKALVLVESTARRVTGSLQNGSLPFYMRITFTAFAAVIWGAVALSDGGRLVATPDIPLVNYATLLVIVVGAVVVILTRSRLTAICALGAIGTGISIVFVLYGAIDVAMTQLMIEILVVVFLAIAVLRLPRTPQRMGFRVGDAGVSAMLGLGTTVVLISVLATPLDMQLTEYFQEKSAPVAFGRNIVNVILVDFRALDTLGEIAVIAIAAVGAVAALTAGRGGLAAQRRHPVVERSDER
ncbi:MAG: hydrogen gas-evolving membrane-bound hydrogenase subunit E [Pseudomonadota bacterium]